MFNQFTHARFVAEAAEGSDSSPRRSGRKTKAEASSEEEEGVSQGHVKKAKYDLLGFLHASFFFFLV